MSLVSQAQLLATRTATEFKSIRTALATKLSKTESYIAGAHPEGRVLASPALVNDLANARLRGATFTFTGSATGTSASVMDTVFDGTASVLGLALNTTDWTVEFTLPRTLSWGSWVGIGFGNAGWAPTKVRIEAFSEGVWKDVINTTTNTSEELFAAIPTNSGTGTTKLRVTLNGNALTRLVHLWGFNFNSDMWTQLQMPRRGGSFYGSIDTIAGATVSEAGQRVFSPNNLPTKAQVGLSNVPNTDATARANHTGTQSLDTTTDSATRLAMTSAERSKLTGIATGATANSTDAALRARSSHTGTQDVSTITGLDAVLEGIDAQAVVDNSNAGLVTDPVGSMPRVGTSGWEISRLTLDATDDGSSRLAMTSAERSKLSGIATGATANSPNATLLARANHTGTQSLDTTTDSGTRLAMTSAERTKLTGIATSATANDTDANLKARANHTGTQSLDTTTDSATRLAMTSAERTKLAGISAATAPQVTEYATAQSLTAYAIPAGAVELFIECLGAGGGGGSGRSGLAGTGRSGGQGGWHGFLSTVRLPVASLGVSTLYVTVGTGGAGGAAPAASTLGISGSNGGMSHVLTASAARTAANTVVAGSGGLGGGGGGTGAGAVNNTQVVNYHTNLIAADVEPYVLSAIQAQWANMGYPGAGDDLFGGTAWPGVDAGCGGGGGGITTANVVAANGGKGSGIKVVRDLAAAGGAGGITASKNGEAGSPIIARIGGTGGGGGAPQSAAAGGAGGAGVRGAGGGGGAGGTDGQGAGAGGDGGAGVVRITAYF